ncbi:Gfo/Idh/MocA family oxidoreductase, partial [Streptomyces sp. NPDC002896]|uniref:Gfo/Idh/MocA family oxidoreductase n=1 Tax=Streptomyces sp. NPDC002896 TaxID=3154438 RepID=UPI003323B107
MAQRETLGVAVIGTGKMGADHVRRLHEVASGARVAAVVDIDEVRAEKIANAIEGCTAYTDPSAAMAAAGVDPRHNATPGPAPDSPQTQTRTEHHTVKC